MRVADIDGKEFQEAPCGSFPVARHNRRQQGMRIDDGKCGYHGSSVSFGFSAVRSVQAAAQVVTTNCASWKAGSMPSLPCRAPALEAYPYKPSKAFFNAG